MVKHLKGEPQSKRRIHVEPNAVEIAACLPWLNGAIALIRPKVLASLGATAAAQALLGKQFRVTKERGHFVEPALAQFVTAMVHPSSILGAPDVEVRRREMELLEADLEGGGGDVAPYSLSWP